jgi:hypothetical protein
VSDRSIPVVQIVGPGSQPGEIDETTLAYISLPTEMSKYRAPDVALDDLVAQSGARETLHWLDRALADWTAAGETLLTDLGRIDAASRTLLDQILGEGEVSVRYAGRRKAISQESVLTGVWLGSPVSAPPAPVGWVDATPHVHVRAYALESGRAVREWSGWGEIDIPFDMRGPVSTNVKAAPESGHAHHHYLRPGGDAA